VYPLVVISPSRSPSTQQHVGIAHARRSFGLMPMPTSPRIADAGCRRGPGAGRRRDRQPARLRKLRECLARRAIPAAAADDDERRRGAGEQRVRGPRREARVR
jgi:hypothetical protein